MQSLRSLMNFDCLCGRANKLEGYVIYNTTVGPATCTSHRQLRVHSWMNAVEQNFSAACSALPMPHLVRDSRNASPILSRSLASQAVRHHYFGRYATSPQPETPCRAAVLRGCAAS